MAGFNLYISNRMEVMVEQQGKEKDRDLVG